MQNKNIQLVPIMLLYAVAFMVTGCATSTKQAPAAAASPTQQQNTNTTAAPVQPGPKEFSITASNFSYDVKEIDVNKGDTVTIHVKDVEGYHDWVIDAFKTRTKQLQPGETATITFVADQTGSFEYYSSIGQQRSIGMTGKVVVH